MFVHKKATDTACKEMSFGYLILCVVFVLIILTLVIGGVVTSSSPGIALAITCCVFTLFYALVRAARYLFPFSIRKFKQLTQSADTPIKRIGLFLLIASIISLTISLFLWEILPEYPYIHYRSNIVCISIVVFIVGFLMLKGIVNRICMWITHGDKSKNVNIDLWQVAAEEYQEAAGQGDADAQNNLGLMYANGHGVPKNDSKAVEWLQKAADQGHANAQGLLGLMYADGRGIPKDKHKAVEWFQKAADQGHVRAQYVLGMMYTNGDGVHKDFRKAVEWFQKAATQGDEKAKEVLERWRSY